MDRKGQREGKAEMTLLTSDQPIIERCALMNCELEPDTPTLKEIAEGKECQAKYQAQSLIEHYGFKETDKMCEDCFCK
jgi:hypothetical protein